LGGPFLFGPEQIPFGDEWDSVWKEFLRDLPPEEKGTLVAFTLNAVGRDDTRELRHYLEPIQELVFSWSQIHLSTSYDS